MDQPLPPEVLVELEGLVSRNPTSSWRKWPGRDMQEVLSALPALISTARSTEAMRAELDALTPRYPFVAVHLPSHWPGPEITAQCIRYEDNADVFEVRLERHSHDDTPQCQWSFMDAQAAAALGAENERLTGLYQTAVSNRDYYADERNKERAKAEALALQLKAVQTELNETWTDDLGTVWTRPTAWAYMAACRALAKRGDELKAAREALEDALRLLDDGRNIGVVRLNIRNVLSTISADPNHV